MIAYFMAHDAGHALTALPIFPHRRFRHGFVFVNTAKGVRDPKDLIGRPVGIQGYQPAAIVWIKGILQEHFGVPCAQVDWRDAFGILGRPLDGRPEVDYATARGLMEELLLEGEVHALLSPNVLPGVLHGDRRVARLWPDYRRLEVEYHRRTGIFPIMHVLTLRQELLDRHPWVAASVMQAFEEAKRMAYERVRNPRVVPLASFQHEWEEQEALLGPDPWSYGLGGSNARNVETAVRYAHEQELISRRPPLSELFADVAWLGSGGPADHR